jgi:hypothetical protein
VRQLAPVLVVVLGLAACGGSSHPATTNGPDAKAQIKSAYAKFFSGKTPIADRVAVLENGEKFQSVVQSFASIPLAKNVTATVSSVTLQGADRAKVLYTVKLGGSALPKQAGTAVKEDGTWKVGDASLCKLIALQGTTPSACKS